MIIIRADEHHSQLLTELATRTFIESHGSSAKPEEINTYVAEKYNVDVLRKELQDPENIYHIIYYNNQAAWYNRFLSGIPRNIYLRLCKYFF